MPSTNKDLVLRWFDAINRHDLQAVGDVVAADATWSVPVSPEPLRGREAIRQLVGGFLTAFPDLRLDVRAQTEESNRVVSQVVASGTNDGELLGMPPTGKPASWNVVHIHTVRGGELVEDIVVFDRLALMEQLGAVPEPAGASA